MADESMTPAEYIEKRLDEQIGWYNRRSTSYQKKYKNLRKIELVGAALIPLLSGLAVSVPNMLGGGTNSGAVNTGTIITIIVALMGAAIAVIAGLLGLGRYQELWFEYRATCENLTREKLLYQTRVEPYNDANAFSLLVQRAEALMSRENTNWTHSLLPKEGKKDPSNG